MTASALKETLPAVAWSVGEYSDGHRTGDSVLEHSGLIGIDLDHLPQGYLGRVKDTLAELDGVQLVFTSPSGDGLKIVFAYDAVPLDYHDQAYNKCELAVTAELKLRGLTLQTPDPACKNINRLCYLCYDPDVRISNNEPLTFEPQHEQREQKQKVNDWIGLKKIFSTASRKIPVPKKSKFTASTATNTKMTMHIPVRFTARIQGSILAQVVM